MQKAHALTGARSDEPSFLGGGDQERGEEQEAAAFGFESGLAESVSAQHGALE